MKNEGNAGGTPPTFYLVPLAFINLRFGIAANQSE